MAASFRAAKVVRPPPARSLSLGRPKAGPEGAYSLIEDGGDEALCVFILPMRQHVEVSAQPTERPRGSAEETGQRLSL